MNLESYGQYIADHIRDWPVGEPVTNADVAGVLAGAFGMSVDNAKKVTNVNMKRLADKGELIRVQKGVYGKVKTTPFGKLPPRAGEITAGLLLREGNTAIGFITGPTLLNTVGLCTWIPKECHITTNHYRRRLPTGASIRVHKPVVPINDNNALYLQALELFIATERYPIDAENPDEILRAVLQRNHINNEKLILYARRYFSHTVLLKAIDISLGGLGL